MVEHQSRSKLAREDLGLTRITAEQVPILAGTVISSLDWDQFVELNTQVVRKANALFAGDLTEQSLTTMQGFLRLYLKGRASGAEIDSKNLDAYKACCHEITVDLERVAKSVINNVREVDRLRASLESMPVERRVAYELDAGSMIWPCAYSRINDLDAIDRVVGNLAPLAELYERSSPDVIRKVSGYCDQIRDKKVASLLRAINSASIDEVLNVASTLMLNEMPDPNSKSGRDLDQALLSKSEIKLALHLLFAPRI